MNKDAGKHAAAQKALEFVRSGMTLGIGTGSTAKYFIDGLGEKIRDGWTLKGVATSTQSEHLARNAGIEMITPDETSIIDLAVDGADEADPNRHLIKGGGAALLREKIVAASASKFIVIADDTKRVPFLGGFPLPVEIEPFGWGLTTARLRTALMDAGFPDAALTLRAQQGAPVQTDGGNLIIDCALTRIDDPAALETTINMVPGVVENGLFCAMADMIIYGSENGISSEGTV